MQVGEIYTKEIITLTYECRRVVCEQFVAFDNIKQPAENIQDEMIQFKMSKLKCI